MNIDENKFSEKIGLNIIIFEEKILKEILKLKKNNSPEGFKKFRKVFKEETFKLYFEINQPFRDAAAIERTKDFLLKFFQTETNSDISEQ